jgi:hypothetical protein
MNTIYINTTYTISVKGTNSKFSTNNKIELSNNMNKFSIMDRSDVAGVLLSLDNFFRPQPTRLMDATFTYPRLDDEHLRFALQVYLGEDRIGDYWVRVTHTGRKHKKYECIISKDEWGGVVARHNFESKELDKMRTWMALNDWTPLENI